MIGRRTLITGLVALVAAPAIVKVASLMPVNAALRPTYLTLNDITREAIWLFEGSNMFIRGLPQYEPHGGPTQVDVLYGSMQMHPGTMLRIRLPADFVPEPVIPDKLALATAALVAAPVLLEKPVTRRFWA